MEPAPRAAGTASAALEAAPPDPPAADAHDPERRPRKRRSKALQDLQASSSLAAEPASAPCGAASWVARSRSGRSSNAAQGARGAGGDAPLTPHAGAQRYTRAGAYEYPCWWAALQPGVPVLPLAKRRSMCFIARCCTGWRALVSTRAAAEPAIYTMPFLVLFHQAASARSAWHFPGQLPAACLAQ